MNSEEHSHCLLCIKRNCNAKVNKTICEMVSCPRGCPMRYHGCKEGEHSLLCAEERTECINKEYGCPLILPRKRLLQHLPICPASVIYCSAEWNRLNIESAKYKITEKPHIVMKKTNADCGQLDMALAMRDHRILVDSLLAPLQTRKILQNPLTQVYPAAPFGRPASCPSDMEKRGNSDYGDNVQEDEEDVRWDTTISLLEKQKQMVKKRNQQADALGHLGVKSGANLKDHIEEKSASDNTDASRSCTLNSADISEPGTSAAAAAQDIYSESTNDRSPHNSPSEEGEGIEHDKQQSVIGDGEALRNILSVSLTVECIAKYQTKSCNIYTFLCAQEVRRDEYSNHFHTVHNRIHPDLSGWLEQRCPLAYLGCPFSFRRLKPSTPGLTICHSWLQESFGLTYIDPHLDSRHPTPAHLLPSFPETTSSLGDSEGHGPALYLPSQSKSCMHTKQVLYAGVRGNSCVRVDSSSAVSSSAKKVPRSVHLDELPFEVLRHMTKFLDSFSLNNLALVSRPMRDLCCSVLQDRGMVSLEWEKQVTGSRTRWQVNTKRWGFSSCFDAVQQWSYSGHNPISNHLQSCPYNQDRLLPTHKFCHVPLAHDPLKVQIRDMLQERMQRRRYFGGPRWYIAAMKSYIDRLCDHLDKRST